MAAALEWQTNQALQCDGCGGWLDETTAPGRDFDFDAEIVACHRCATKDRKLTAWRDSKGEMAGARVRTWEIDSD